MDAEPAHEPTRILTSAGHGLPPDLRRQVLSGPLHLAGGLLRRTRSKRLDRTGRVSSSARIVDAERFVRANAAVLWKRLAYAGETYTVFGLSIVFTFPDCRGRGYGRAVVEAATAHIRRSDADVATTLAHYLQGLHRRDQSMLRWEHVFDSYHVLLCPPAMMAAFPHCESGPLLHVDGHEVVYWHISAHTVLFNYTGHPALVLPHAQHGEGLPIGLQLVGKRWGDARLLRIARAVAAVSGGCKRPAGY